ncbi:hypothetical protein L207DRAFT_592257 [Hyaloscypha variabilis F]|uniref:Uncharacterized protein n=1 Tax=Hyaloscypha variabilis (strain UAMH 11265 / GT02V1 / F) TaxID=1149755 RepID=A0A2J6QX90_HYAVF|nr:hypothetical protein L207DRAFT_592257 [Hyaloscypha variabilis F]
MSSLDLSLWHDVPLANRPLAVEHLWGQQSSKYHFPDETSDLGAYFDSYFKYYARQCDLIGRHDNGEFSSVETHRHIMDIVQLLRQPLRREEVRKQISDLLRSANTTQQECSINLAARLLLMIRIGEVQHEYSKGRYLKWEEGSLREFVHNHFAASAARGHERIKLEKSFNALSVQRIGGVKIWWTDNLADHLRMMDDDKAVFIFHHASFLEHQTKNSLYPPLLIEETLWTLKLLFPTYNPAIKKWYQKTAAKSAFGLDKRLVGIGNLNAEERQIDNFSYWRDRLVILKEVYDEARPSTLSQFWHDRRNGPQWYTFWVALWVLVLTILTILLAVVQCVEGGLQVYLSMKS